MNALQATHRLAADYLELADPHNPTADAALDLLHAINTGMLDFYRLAPRHFRTQTFGRTQSAPATVALDFISPSTVAGTPFAAIPRGTSLVIEGLAYRVEGPSAISGDYIGYPVTAQVDATIYRDVLALPEECEEITGALECHDRGSRRLMMPMENPARFIVQCGSPLAFTLEQYPPARGEAPAQYLRFWPLPSHAFQVHFSALVAPVALTFASMEAGDPLPMLPHHVQPYFLPLAAAHLVNSRFFSPRQSKQLVLQRADMVRQVEIPRLSPTPGPVIRRSGTPKGF